MVHDTLDRNVSVRAVVKPGNLLGRFSAQLVEGNFSPGNIAALSVFFVLLLFVSMNGFDWLKKLKKKKEALQRKHNCKTALKKECDTIKMDD